MKTNVQDILLSDVCGALLDGPDGWFKGWVFHDRPTPMRLRRHQGDRGVMFWAGIMGDTMIGPSKVPVGAKITYIL